MQETLDSIKWIDNQSLFEKGNEIPNIITNVLMKYIKLPIVKTT